MVAVIETLNALCKTFGCQTIAVEIHRSCVEKHCLSSSSHEAKPHMTFCSDLVYANYARVEDFEYLEDNYPEINLTGTIIIARYGKIFRGNKALHAQAAGAKGLILYSDPADYAVDGDISLYPDGWWLPETGAQRGNIWVSDAKGDPLTPGFPANAYAYRKNDTDTPLPKIPAHPIGYGDARRLLSEMKGPVVSEADGWKGNLNVTYRIGPGFTDPQRKAKMNIYTTREIRNTYDVIGYIRGDTEPDRYVILGNHRDAWVYGSTDPSSGTATLMEVARAFGEQVKSGWRPRRSILFTSWGSEEYGLLGSTEYVEEFQKILGERAVAYLNVDCAVVGNYTLRVKSTPLLYNAIYEAARQYKCQYASPLEVRQLNDQLMQVERAFIEPLGLPNRKFLRHLVFAPSNNDYYAADAFPGIVDAMFNIDEDPDQETRWRIVREQMAITAFVIQSAATTLADVLQF
ncbi:glutamate carboxypeptidase 2-like [Amphiura filiformis]|uniref:glutamate carboxypeptidase 2-like n=1 Tax=Amphiura filiformis TaxID=82378 RepID=UPI003B223EAC